MSKSKFENDKVTLGLIMFFYFASCGSERLFQSLEFTFGLCGPLNLPASKAVITDTCYNGGFFVGRMVSVMCPKIMSPKIMVKVRLCAVVHILLKYSFLIFYFSLMAFLRRNHSVFQLLWRIFCQKCVRVNFRNFHTMESKFPQFPHCA